MKVLQIVPSIGKNDGIANVLVEFSKKFNGDIVFDYIVLNPLINVSSKYLFKDEIEKMNGNVFYLGSPLDLIKFKKKWRQFCEKHYGEYTFLENNLVFLGAYFSKAISQLGVKKVITHVHNPVYGDSKVSNFRNKLFYKITGSNLGNVLFSSSSESGYTLFGKSVQRKPWYVINNAFTVEDFKFDQIKREQIREKMHWTNKYIIGHIGRFSPQKNHELIIRSFNKVSKTYKGARLVLIGDGAEKVKVKKLIGKLGLEEKVDFLGIRNDVSDLLQGMDLFVFPSRFEGLGIAAVEAQISGVPCLVSDRLPQEAIISNCQILSIDHDAVNYWCKAMVKTRSTPRILNGVELAKKGNFDITEEADKIKKIYFKEAKS